MKIIEEFNTEDGAIIECSCGLKFNIFYGSPKECSCGKQYIIETTIKRIA